MNINDIEQLYYITHIANLPSILHKGILSFNKADKIGHKSIAEQGVQARRENKKIPGTNTHLHDYANLYFDAHNPMLSARRHLNDSICILIISKYVLELSGIIITDQNASRACRFMTLDDGLPLLSKEEIFAQFWINRDDPMKEYRLKGVKCAEVLVPVKVDVSLITGAYVANDTVLRLFQQISSLPVEIRFDIFF
jgi:hypothetical protein